MGDRTLVLPRGRVPFASWSSSEQIANGVVMHGEYIDLKKADCF
jgi:hypothetical protein